MTPSERTASIPQEQEPRLLYKPRVFERVSEDAKEIRNEMEAARDRQPLSESEKATFIRFENTLGETLEKIYSLTPKSATAYTEYLLTEEGRASFEKLFGISVDGDDPDSVKRFLLGHVPEILSAKGKDRTNFFRQSNDYHERTLFSELSATMDEDAGIDIRNAATPDRIHLLLTPEESLQRSDRLRKFKGTLKKFHSELMNGPHLGREMERVISGTLDLYSRRVNEMIIESSQAAASLKEKSSLLGREALNDSEEALLRLSSITENPETDLSRMDKVIHGASDERDPNGWNKQVGEELARYADTIESEIIESTLNEKDSLDSLGLDQEKVDAKSLTFGETQSIGDELLSRYGLLSTFSPDTFDPDDPKPAPDEKWRFVLHERYDASGFVTDPKSKTVKGPKKNLSVVDVLPVLAHEIEGHVIQHMNKERLPLRIFKRSGAGRWAPFAECAAMRNQDLVSRKAFGTSFLPGPHYARAMAKKLEGGSYLECVEAHYESMLSLSRAKRDAGMLDEDRFRKEASSALKRSINRAKRLFVNELSLDSPSTFLVHSKDTAYLEQTQVFQAFKEQGIENLLYVGSANSETLRFLCGNGFIDSDSVIEPGFFSLEIWERLRGNYARNEKE
jgi:hypothetical protein